LDRPSKITIGEISQEELLAMIKDLHQKNPETFGTLSTNELGKVIVYLIKHPKIKTPITKLFKDSLTAMKISTRGSFVPLHERELTNSKTSVNGIMERALTEWYKSKEPKPIDKSIDMTYNGMSDSDSEHRKKYLKYKTKYMALKAKLGL
jgi:hypothetical protein